MVATINFHDILHLQPGVCYLTLGVGNEDFSDDLEQSILTFLMATIEYFLVMMQFMLASQRLIIMSKTFFGGKCVQNNLGVGVRPSFWSMPKISLIFLSKSVPKQGMTLYLIKNHFSFAWYFAWRFLSICYNIAHPYMHKTRPELLFHLLHPSGKFIILLLEV